MMNKDDIYKLIGYHGEYSSNVKKAIRKLLKDNHPDNKGDRKKFELINEVKKELETGQVTYKIKEKKGTYKENDDIDYDYCYHMINETKVKKSNLNILLKEKKEKLHSYEIEYKDLYQNSLDLENNLLINSPYIKKTKSIKDISIIFLIIMIILLSLAIFKNSNVLFILFVLLAIVCIYCVQKYLLLMHKMTEYNKKRIANYVEINNVIRENIKNQDVIKKEILELKMTINTLDNDLRFYKNLLK